VWWQDDDTSRLMLLFAYLMTRREAWSDARIRLLGSGNPSDTNGGKKALEQALEDARIEGEAEAVVQVSAASIGDHSSDASITFLPFRFSGHQIIGPAEGALEELVAGLPVTALVLAAEDIDLDAEPEDGKPGEMAAALDALANARQKVRQAEQGVEKASVAAAEAEQNLESLVSVAGPGVDSEVMEKIEAAAAALDAAQAQVQKAARRAAKARAKEEDAAHAAEAVGASPGQEDSHTDPSSPTEPEEGSDDQTD
jgi:hypothetical protein